MYTRTCEYHARYTLAAGNRFRLYITYHLNSDYDDNAHNYKTLNHLPDTGALILLVFYYFARYIDISYLFYEKKNTIKYLHYFVKSLDTDY